MAPRLPRTVKALGLVSLLNDASSEMITPLLPAFVTTTLGAGPAFLGLIEGAADAVASLLKIVSGTLSDRLARRKPIVVAGYGLASLARPLTAAATAAWHVLAVRIADRIGKGVRSAPRDAMLAEVTPEKDRGRAFGFQRAMDHAGAVVGPLIASAVLWIRHDLRLLFALSAVPAALTMAALVFGVKEEPRAPATATGPPSLLGGAPLGPGFRRYLAVLAVFTLGNSSDAFLLLRAQEAGIGLAAIPLLWAVHHVAKSAASTHAGVFSDRFGRKAAILAGWSIYALSYAGFALARQPVQIWPLFAVYGFFHALTEGPERALVADLAPTGARGRAFGLYYAVTGAMLLPAGLLTGAIWQSAGAGPALLVGAAMAAVAAAGLLLLVPSRRGAQ
jgi:MFS family permease